MSKNDGRPHRIWGWATEDDKLRLGFLAGRLGKSEQDITSEVMEKFLRAKVPELPKLAVSDDDISDIDIDQK